MHEHLILSEEKFAFLARLLKSREPSITAARSVYVHGLAPAESARRAGVSIQSLSRSMDSLEDLHEMIEHHYLGKALRRKV